MSKRTYSQAELNRKKQALARKKYRAATGQSPTQVYGPALRKGFLNRTTALREMKGIDVDLSTPASLSSDTTTNTDIVLLNPIQQGAGEWNRIGRSVTMLSVRVKGILQFLGAPLAVNLDRVGNIARLVLVYDRQANAGGSIPIFSDIFGRTVGDGTESSQVMDPLKYDNMNRFTILKDEVITFNQFISTTTGTTNYDLRVHEFDFYKTLNLPSHYASTSNPITAADLSGGALYLVCRQAFAVTGNQISMDAKCMSRLRFTD